MDYKLIIAAILTAVIAAMPEVAPLLNLSSGVQGAIGLVCAAIIRQLGVSTPSKREKELENVQPRS